MITATEISHAIIPHLLDLTELRDLIDQAVTSGAGDRQVAAVDALLGAMEDIQLHARSEEDIRTRFVLETLLMEAEVLLETSLDRDGSTLAGLGLWRDAEGVWQTDAGRLSSLPAGRLADVCRRFVRSHLNPFLRSWKAPAQPVGLVLRIA